MSLGRQTARQNWVFLPGYRAANPRNPCGYEICECTLVVFPEGIIPRNNVLAQTRIREIARYSTICLAIGQSYASMRRAKSGPWTALNRVCGPREAVAAPSLIIMSDTGRRRYSRRWNPGRQSYRPMLSAASPPGISEILAATG
jgi:hypothetical protein